MAKSKSIERNAEKHEKAVNAAYETYDLVLELETLLQAFNELEPGAPKWAFGLSRMAERARLQADHAHHLVLTLNASS